MSKTEKQAFISTAICLIFMIMGSIVEQTGGQYYQLLFAIGIIGGGWKQTTEGIVEIIEDKKLNVDLLMALAAIGASIIGDWREGNMLIFIFCLSGALEEYTTNKSKKEITSLMKMQPKVAMKLLSDGSTKEVGVEELEIDDLVIVAKGASVPIDGEITKGATSIDEAAVSGESVPVDKTIGDNVFSGTINTESAFTMKVSKKADETLFAKIIKLVEEAQAQTSKTAGFIERIENVYVRVVLISVPLVIVLTHFFFGWAWEESFYRGMVMLVVASPCALVASATPATLAAMSSGAKRGVLFKGGAHLEELYRLKAISFDKTGTLTKGEPEVTDEYFFGNKADLLPILLAMESQSTHPLALAILAHYSGEGIAKEIEVKEIAGFGLQASYEGNEYKLGKKAATTGHEELINGLINDGKTIIFLSKNEELQAIIALLDIAKEDAKPAIDYFKAQGIHTSMFTGDNEGTARVIAKEVGVDQYFGNLLPEDKTRLIEEKRAQYNVNMMVGDGINDAPALATAAIGVAMGEGSDVAMDVADMVLMKNDLGKLVFSHKVAKKLHGIVRINMIVSVGVICFLLLSNFFQIISLPLGVIAHEGSTILVILNGLRMLKNIK
ncbi:MAG: cadmium-translocating P-type ATPase [Streptococcaceae bacterium]|jgi:Cd2+/Zn2+-exporting ATPase|nr:cadmium-translocating P-type ATPase [Streptococcaceae bacterium]